MAKQYATIQPDHFDFIGEQKVFFIASCSGSEVNISPKGYNSLQIVDDKTVVYLDYPGSGDRTARDIDNEGDITLMFTSFTEKAWIVRLFCIGERIEKNDARFAELFRRFHVDIAGVRRLILFHVHAVESSCGESVPFYEYQGDRESLREWAVAIDHEGELENYVAAHRIPPELP